MSGVPPTPIRWRGRVGGLKGPSTDKGGTKVSKADKIYDIDLEEGTIDGEDFADHKDHVEGLEAIVERHARTMAAYGLDYTDTDLLVVVDRDLAVVRFGEEAVKRLEDEA